MKKVFLLILLLIPLLGGSLTVEKLLRFTSNTGIWGDYTAVLVHWLANAEADQNAEAEDIAETDDDIPVPQFNTLTKGLTATSSSIIPFYGTETSSRLFSFELSKGITPLKSISLTAQQDFTGPDPAAGFRIFMEVVERSV